MPPLSPATRRANSVRRRNLNAEIKRLKNYYAGTYRGVFGRTAGVRTMNSIRNMSRELAARRIQVAARARQQRARAHTRNRAPLRNLAATVFHPARVNRMGGFKWTNKL